METDYKLQINMLMKDNFKKEKNTEKEKFNIKIKLFLKVSLFKIKKVDLANSSILLKTNSI